MKNITEISKVIRSKNSSPFELTLDIILKTKEYYGLLKKKECINKKIISELYNISENKINRIIFFDPANAIKITLMRNVVSGSPGDTDVYGAQQHGPLLNLKVDI
jgi:hypothetical protein